MYRDKLLLESSESSLSDFVAQFLRPLTMRVEEADHHGRLRAIKRQFIAVSNEHKLILTSLRESAITGFHKAGFGSELDRRKRRPNNRGPMRGQ
jgi:hypothetical protein